MYGNVFLVIGIVLLGVFISGCSPGEDPWEIVGDSVILDDENAYFKVTPGHSIKSI